MPSSPYQRRRIKKLQKDIADIEASQFHFLEVYSDDPDAQIFALQQKKQLLVRALIFEYHLSIEDALESAIKNKLYLLNARSKHTSGQRARRYFDHMFPEAREFISGQFSMGFKRKLILSRALKVIGKRLYDDLDRLNSLRNRAGHHWTLGDVIRRGVKRGKPKKYALTFRGKNLYQPAAMIEFLGTYKKAYLDLMERAYPWK
jgi:hypothetical protein